MLKLAQIIEDIVEKRKMNVSFQDILDILEVEGIKEPISIPTYRIFFLGEKPSMVQYSRIKNRLRITFDSEESIPDDLSFLKYNFIELNFSLGKLSKAHMFSNSKDKNIKSKIYLYNYLGEVDLVEEFEPFKNYEIGNILHINKGGQYFSFHNNERDMYMEIMEGTKKLTISKSRGYSVFTDNDEHDMFCMLTLSNKGKIILDEVVEDKSIYTYFLEIFNCVFRNIHGAVITDRINCLMDDINEMEENFFIKRLNFKVEKSTELINNFRDQKEVLVEEVLKAEDKDYEDYCYLRDNEPEVFKTTNWDREFTTKNFDYNKKVKFGIENNEAKVFVVV